MGTPHSADTARDPHSGTYTADTVQRYPYRRAEPSGCRTDDRNVDASTRSFLIDESVGARWNLSGSRDDYRKDTVPKNRHTPIPSPSRQPPTSPAVPDLAFQGLVAPFIQRLYRFLAVRLGDEREARDALQETLLAAWQGLPRLRDVDDPWPWLAGIAAHKAADVGRRRRPVLPLTDDSQRAVEADDTLSRCARRVQPSAGQGTRDSAASRLPPPVGGGDRAALGLRLGTVKLRVARARRLLLGELE